MHGVKFVSYVAVFWLCPVPNLGVNRFVLFTHGVKFVSYVAVFWLCPVLNFGLNRFVLFTRSAKFMSYIAFFLLYPVPNFGVNRFVLFTHSVKFVSYIALFWLCPVPNFGFNRFVLFAHSAKFLSFIALFWLYPVPYLGINRFVLLTRGVKFASYFGLTNTASDYTYTNYQFTLCFIGILWDTLKKVEFTTETCRWLAACNRIHVLIVYSSVFHVLQLWFVYTQCEIFVLISLYIYLYTVRIVMVERHVLWLNNVTLLVTILFPG
jgi:hypothetical protein